MDDVVINFNLVLSQILSRMGLDYPVIGSNILSIFRKAALVSCSTSSRAKYLEVTC